MQSSQFVEMAGRLEQLKRRYLPARKNSGAYTDAEQDQMRALRLLAHAEIEHYLEVMSALLVADLEREILSARKSSASIAWAIHAVASCRQAIEANMGVADKNIRSLFKPLGFTDDDFETVATTFLDRMRQFGKQRGDVAHRSALRASHQLNRVREEAFLDEIAGYLRAFDSLIISRRLRSYFD